MRLRGGKRGQLLFQLRPGAAKLERVRTRLTTALSALDLRHAAEYFLV
jgi:hypothetical protein